MLAHLVMPENFAHLHCDLGFLQGLLLASRYLLADLGQGDLRRFQQLPSLAPALFFQQWIVANHQPFAGIVGRGDFGQVGLI